MKTGTLTFHQTVNYGAILQAYALQTALKKLGIENQIINHQATSWAIRGMFSGIFWKQRLILFCYLLLGFGVISYQRRIKKTKNLISDKLLLTSYKVFPNKSLPDEFDIETIIVGSDQIWNGDFGFPDFFMLKDFPGTQNAIAYAASFGMQKIPLELQKKYKDGFARFSNISVREKHAIKFVTDAGYTVTHVCDPVLLLNQHDWCDFSETNAASENILFCYFMHDSYKDFMNELENFAKKHSCKVKIFLNSLSFASPRHWMEFIKLIKTLHLHSRRIEFCLDADPKDFVKSIARSKWVISDSFHALMFSVIFRKNVRILKPHGEFRMRMFSRITDFADYISVDNFIQEDISVALNSLDTEKSTEYDETKLLFWINNSHKWLKNNIATL